MKLCYLVSIVVVKQADNMVHRGVLFLYFCAAMLSEVAVVGHVNIMLLVYRIDVGQAIIQLWKVTIARTCIGGVQYGPLRIPFWQRNCILQSASR